MRKEKIKYEAEIIISKIGSELLRRVEVHRQALRIKELIGKELVKKVKAQKMLILIQVNLTFKYTLMLAEIKESMYVQEASIKLDPKQIAKEDKERKK